MKQTTRVSFDTVIDGNDVCIEFNRTTVFGRENYGADADGRRGMMIDTIDEDVYTDVEVSVEGATPVFTNQTKSVMDAVEHYMQTHDPEPEEREPDYDDRGEDE